MNSVIEFVDPEFKRRIASSVTIKEIRAHLWEVMNLDVHELETIDNFYSLDPAARQDVSVDLVEPI